jgi:hypothetical protein
MPILSACITESAAIPFLCNRPTRLISGHNMAELLLGRLMHFDKLDTKLRTLRPPYRCHCHGAWRLATRKQHFQLQTVALFDPDGTLN